MTTGEAAQVITAVAAMGAMLISAVGLLVSFLNRQKIDGVKAHVEKVEHATNGLSARNEAIAKKLGIEQGKAAEKANPTK